MNNKDKNLIIELATMIESGSIIVGALGLSQDSANYVRELYKILDKIQEKERIIKDFEDLIKAKK